MPKAPSHSDAVVPRDPVGAYRRDKIAALRIGNDVTCASCPEGRPKALIPDREPKMCAERDRKERGLATEDEHHVAAKANDATTIRVPVNDHQAELSPAQYDWPKETRENRDGSPLLRAAACVHGFTDIIFYLIKKLLLWIPEMLERLDALLIQKLGRKWWFGTPLEEYAPKK